MTARAPIAVLGILLLISSAALISVVGLPCAETAASRLDNASLRGQSSSEEPSLSDSDSHSWDGIKELGDDHYSIARSEIDYALSNLDKLAREGRMVSQGLGNDTKGLRVFSILGQGALRKMGLENNDVLTQLNGFELSDTRSALDVFSKLQSDKRFSLKILRNGEPMTLEYTVL